MLPTVQPPDWLSEQIRPPAAPALTLFHPHWEPCSVGEDRDPLDPWDSECSAVTAELLPTVQIAPTGKGL